MTLLYPSFFTRYRSWLVFGGLGILLLGTALFLFDCGEGYLFKRDIEKKKEAIKTETDKIANISGQIIELEKEKAAATANVNNATQELQKDIFGREEAKKETNQALANLEKAVNSNSNIDRTAADLERILKELDQ